MKYLSANQYYREKFGCKIYRLSIDAGFTCPNRDGTVGTGGCIFCGSHGGSSFTPEQTLPIFKQLAEAKCRVAHKNPGGKYIAYFQSFTNTYGPISHLKKCYLEALEPEDVVGIAIGTRPDCLSQDVVELLSQLPKPVSVELGLQTVNPSSVSYIRRGYSNEVYQDAVNRLRAANIDVVTHIILGLPGESVEDMKNTTSFAIAAGTNGVKFHLLHVLRGTDLEKEYLSGKFSCLTMEEYGSCLKACMSLLLPETVVHRITGDGANADLIAPLWSGDKKRVLNYLRHILEEDS